MPAFDYTARDSGGRSIKGQLEAASMDAAASQLLAAGSTPIKIQPAKSAAQQSLNIDLRVLLSKQVKLADVVIFCRQMQTLTRAGVPIIRAIDARLDCLSLASVGPYSFQPHEVLKLDRLTLRMMT